MESILKAGYREVASKREKMNLVTGSAGFIGRRLAAQLGASGERVRGLGRAHDCPGLDDYVQADLVEEDSWQEAFAGIDCVYHLAGKAHALSERLQDSEQYRKANVETTTRVLRAAHAAGVRRLVFFSSIKAMSRDNPRKLLEVPEEPWDERHEIEPDTPYGASKLAAEAEVLRGGYVREPVVLRLCMVYGPGSKGNMDRMLRAVDRRRFPPIPEVENRRSMVHVDDVVRAAMLAGRHPRASGQVFIVSDGEAYSTRYIYECMCEALGRSAPRWSVPLWAWRAAGVLGDWIGWARGQRFVFDTKALEKLVGSAWFSSKKIEQTIGFQPLINLKAALPEMVRELRQTVGMPGAVGEASSPGSP